MMKPSRPSFLHRALRAFPALAALALLPAAAHAASVNIAVGSTQAGAEGTIWFERTNHPLRTGDTITILVPTTPAIDELSVVDGAGTNLVFNFRMRNSTGQVLTRQAHVVGVWDDTMAPENGCLAFVYTIQDADSLVEGELLPPSGSLFGGAGIATAVLTESGDTIRSITGIRAPNPPGANTPFVDWMAADPTPVTINPKVAITSGDIGAMEFSEDSHGTRRTDQTIDIYVPVMLAVGLDPASLPADFALRFQFSEKDGVRTAPLGPSPIGTAPSGAEALWFRYTIGESDYSTGPFYPAPNKPLFMSSSGYNGIRNLDGDMVTGFGELAYPNPDISVAEDIIVNPDNSTSLDVYFLDSDGNRFPPEAALPLQEGDTVVRYVVDIGRVPRQPVDVTIDFGVVGIFGASQTTTVTFETRSIVTNAIAKVSDDGAGPTGTHTYPITASRSDGGSPVQMNAEVSNTDPFFVRLASDKLFGTSTNLTYTPGTNVTVAIQITNKVVFSDIALDLDEPYRVAWTYSGSGTAGNASVEKTATTEWTATGMGTLREGETTVYVEVWDKNGGYITTNITYSVTQAPLPDPEPVVYADPAPWDDYNGLGGIGVGDFTLTIRNPYDATLFVDLGWIQKLGTTIPGWTASPNFVNMDAYPYSGEGKRYGGGVGLVTPQVDFYNVFYATYPGYDSFYYRWQDDLSEGSGMNASAATPISANATVKVWDMNTVADSGGGINTYYTPVDPTPKVLYLFSREYYRMDNFGDIDHDELGDRWEMLHLSVSSGEDDESVNAAEDASGVYGTTGNKDADGLPVNCFGNVVKFQVRNDIQLYHDPLLTNLFSTISTGVYDVNVFRYPLDPSDVKRFGYVPLGRDRDGEIDSPEITAFDANPYVDKDAKNQISKVCVNFDNRLEFRGVGEFRNVWDGVEEVSFRPVGDGDDPGTDPTKSDTDGDGVPDGWEYYFWAVAYYNVRPDQWVRFDGEHPDGYTFRGTGSPISRDDILAAFRPNGGGSAGADLDNDGLSTYEEYLLGTNPLHWDTDGDGMPDGWEVEFGIADGTEKVLGEDENGNQVVIEVDTSTVLLNPLNPEDADDPNNPDGDWMAAASGGALKHFDVYEAFDFDPRTGWGPLVNTTRFTTREEFDLAAWYMSRGLVTSISPENWADWTTNPCDPDSDHDGIPDGWEVYVGNPKFADDWEKFHNPRNNHDGDIYPVNRPSCVDAENEQDGFGDGLKNIEEFLCTEATNVYAYLKEPDENHDNYDYLSEIRKWSNKRWPTNPNATIGIGYADGRDTDGDQIFDGDEKDPNTDPTSVDTDSDWLPDGWECQFGTDPLRRDTFLDYDGDGLQNWQEYVTGAVWAWQYDKWYQLAQMDGGFGPQGPGYGDVDMFDFFVSAGYRDAFGSTYGGFGRRPHSWDPAYAGNFYFLIAEPRDGVFVRRLAGLKGAGYSERGEIRINVEDPLNVWDLVSSPTNTIVNDSPGADAVGAEAASQTEARWASVQLGSLSYATTDPWECDSDNDGMSDFYEAYHGLNPLYGGKAGRDIVGKNANGGYPMEPWDLVSYPWLAGDPDADPDKDGLSSREEAVNVTVEGGTHHTDPSPLWITDPSYERSFVNLYYQPGEWMRYSHGLIPPLWYFGGKSGAKTPLYAFSFEANEGYDTDNDNVGDRSEVTVDELQAKADPLDFDKPRRRKALYLNGIDAAARTRAGYVAGYLDKVDFSVPRYTNQLDLIREGLDDLRTFTVEAWIRPENPVSGRDQTIVERGAIVPQDTAKADVSGKRLNFRLSLTPTGAVRGEFHNYQGAHVTLETDAANTGLRAGVWSHVAMTYSGRPSQTGTLSIFVNGLSLASAPSSLQAFNGILPISSEVFDGNGIPGETAEWTQGHYVYDAECIPCSVVVGASDAEPMNTVNGHVTYDNGDCPPPDNGPDLRDFFKGWIDEVRIWDGAAAPETIRSRMFKRLDRIAIAENHEMPLDGVSGNQVAIRYHYTFDNLPDVVPSGDRDPNAKIGPYDVETLPVGLEEVFTAPVDGSYPGVPWWTTAATRGYRYDARHIPWIENTVAHMPDTVRGTQAPDSVKDDPRVKAVRDTTTGDIVGWRVDLAVPTFTTNSVGHTHLERVEIQQGDNALVGNSIVSGPVANLSNIADPYGVTYTTILYGTNHLVYATNHLDSVANGTSGRVRRSDGFDKYEPDEGASILPLEHDVLDWASDLLPLGGAVADFDVELWDGLGMGYDISTVDSDGDGIPDWWEILYGLDPFDDTDAWDDIDHDELDNVAEFLAGTNPLVIDSDGDGHSDYYDRDTDKSLTYGELYDDGDQMPSWWEYLHGLNPRRDDGAEDPDEDGWSNYSEYLVGTDPRAASDHPNPPVVFNVDYAGDTDGNALSGDLYVYAYGDPEMQGRPNAVWMQNLHPKDNGYLQVDNEWCATIRDGKWTYSGTLAIANVANDGALLFEFYTEGMRYLAEYTVGNNMVVADNVSEATWFQCTECGKMYSRAQMTPAPGGGIRSCPRGHVGVGRVLIGYLGSTEDLRCGDEKWGTINHRTGEWTITIPNLRGARETLVGTTMVATYNALPDPVFPFQMRQKWTNMKSNAKEITSERDDGTVENTSSTHAHEGSQNPNSGSDTTGSWIVSDGHLREGENRFFAFLDQNENSLYDFGEPAGMAVYQPVNVGAGAVQVTIPLTDVLTGYPRFHWTPAATGKFGQPFGAEYFVSLQIGGPVPGDATTSNAVPTVLLYKHPVSSRPFFMENDVADTHGITLGVDTYLDWTWLVYTNRNDTTEYASGSGRFEIGDDATRRAFSILAPIEGTVVSDPSLLAKWAMDWRNEGVVVTLQNTDNGQRYVDGEIVNHPQRIGATYDNDYYFVIEPQKVLGGGAFIDLPDGHYTLTLAEYIDNSGVTAQSNSVSFIIDRTGSFDPNPKTDLFGTISGTLTYFGKIPFTVTDETVAKYDGQTKLLSGSLSHSPVPGTVTVRVISGTTTNVVASDAGAFEGFTHQGLVSQYDTVLGNSYVTYGDQPAVSLQLDFAPQVGSRLVVSYKQYDCPILIQAFSTSGAFLQDVAADGSRLDGNERASFSGVPAVQKTVYNKGAFTVEGLPWGTYYLRAFIDQNANRLLDDWESVGYAMTVLRSDYGMDNYQAIEVAPGARHVEIVIRDRDTDSDQLPDAWEYYYFTNIVTQGGFTLNKGKSTYLWQEYADGELDSNPLVEDTDADGLPDVIEHDIGSNNHAWDSDGDGIGDLEEFLAGSDPIEASSKARFAAPAPGFDEDGTPVIVLDTPFLTSGTYLKYQLYAKESLTDEDWILVGESPLVGKYKTDPVGQPAGTVEIADPDDKGTSATFYKVKALFESDTLRR